MVLEKLIKIIKRQEQIKLLLLIVFFIIFIFLFNNIILNILFTILTFQEITLIFKKRKQIETYVNSLSKKEKQEINQELKTPIFISKNHYILTDNYIINLYNHFSIIKYQDIIWIYQKPKLSFGKHKHLEYYLIIITKDGTKHKFPIWTSALTINYQLEDFTDIIRKKNPNVLTEWSTQNINIIKKNYHFKNLKW